MCKPKKQQTSLLVENKAISHKQECFMDIYQNGCDSASEAFVCWCSRIAFTVCYADHAQKYLTMQNYKLYINRIFKAWFFMEPFKNGSRLSFLWRYLLDLDSLCVKFVSKDGLGCFGAKWRQHDCVILLLYSSSVNEKLILIVFCS